MLNHTLLVRCRLFSVSGWFWGRSDFLPLVKSGRKKIEKIPERLQNHPPTENRRQRTTKVPFNSFIFFNIRF